MNDPKIKQQIVEKIKNSSNILVTVSNSPSVDELSAALGLTLLLNKMDKHATAVVSGEIPPAITFLDPHKTFEDTTDSLRDFIIALDKEKADHLRYKLEGDLVKIYITPYRTTISSEDLEFSQGDYNVELVIALGVENKDHLDEALDGHGKILHDATVVTLTAGEQTSNLGTIDWHDSNASSLSEMLVTLHDALKPDKALLDGSIATAFLTGIVSATERFSNPRTSSRVMSIAAQLMGAGADQQLIASKLEEAEEEVAAETAPAQDDSKTVLEEGSSTKLPKEVKEPKATPPKRNNGELLINHEKTGTLDEVAEEVARERSENATRVAERALEKQEEVAATAEPPVESEAPVEPQDPVQPAVPRGAVSYTPPLPTQAVAVPVQPQVTLPQQVSEPTFGGTLNATSEQAEEDKRRQIENDKNKVILTHNGYLGGDQAATFNSPVNGATAPSNDPAPVDIFNNATSSSLPPLEPASAPTVQAATIAPPSAPQPVFEPVSASAPEVFDTPAAAPAPPTLADIDAQNRASHDDARAAIEAAYAASTPAETSAPFAPPIPDMGLPLPPPLPTDFSGLPPLPPAGQQPEILGDILAPEVQAQPFVASQPAVVSTDPGQFKIPGQ